MTKHCHWLQAETVWKMVSQDLKPIGSKYMFVSKGFASTRNCVAGFAQVWIPAKSHSIDLVETQGRYSFLY